MTGPRGGRSAERCAGVVRHIFTSGTVTGDSGWSDSVLYTTPNFSGFTASAFVAAGKGQGGRNVAATGSYSRGPLAGALVYQRVQTRLAPRPSAPKTR